MPEQVDRRNVMRVLTIAAAACSILPIIFIAKLMTGHEVLYPDFFGLWTFGRFVLTHDPATIYDAARLTAFQGGLGMPVATAGTYPFPYPPPILLLLAPFGALPYTVARLLWLGVSLSAYGASLAVWQWPRPLMLLLLVAPSTVVCCLVGQGGLLLASLMLGGLGLLSSRPVLAGGMLAAVAIKPQFAILVPFYLLFGRYWRALGGAAIMAAVLIVTSMAAFGIGIWHAWIMFLLHQGVSLTAGREGQLMDMMPTVTSLTRLMGGSVAQAHSAQAAAVVLAIYALWHVRGRRDVAARSCLPIGTFLATPYAFHYDLPVVTGSILLVISSRIKAGQRFRAGELPVLLGCVVIPVLLVGHSPVGSACLLVLLGLALMLTANQAAFRGEIDK
ncbi:glycosyltransferase family 87 protein [Gluconacetobacter diazotrophicus]|nr:glycosyltransferase family 87 protein [Gluconacetobacter diazotrophicus]